MMDGEGAFFERVNLVAASCAETGILMYKTYSVAYAGRDSSLGP